MLIPLYQRDAADGEDFTDCCGCGPVSAAVSIFFGQARRSSTGLD